MIQISIIIITIIFIYLISKKKNSENFISYNITDNYLLWKHKNMDNILNHINHTTLKKNNLPYYSNLFINNGTIYNGYVFKPLNCKNIKIGLGDLNPENKMNYGFEIINNKYFKIIELNDQDNIRESGYIVQKMDYCSNLNVLGCSNTGKMFEYSHHDIFALSIQNNIINYILIKNYKNTEKEHSIILHRSKSLLSNNKKLYAYILNTEENNNLDNSFWITRKYSDELQNIKWSINLINQQTLDEKIILGKKGDLIRPKDEIELSPSSSEKNIGIGKQVVIEELLLNQNNKINYVDDNYLNITLSFYNIDLNYLKTIYSIDTVINFDNKKIIIPNQVNTNLGKNKNIKDYQNIIINISDYINIIANKPLKIKIVLRSFKISGDKFNIVSSEKDFKI